MAWWSTVSCISFCSHGTIDIVGCCGPEIDQDSKWICIYGKTYYSAEGWNYDKHWIRKGWGVHYGTTTKDVARGYQYAIPNGDYNEQESNGYTWHCWSWVVGDDEEPLCGEWDYYARLWVESTGYLQVTTQDGLAGSPYDWAKAGVDVELYYNAYSPVNFKTDLKQSWSEWINVGGDDYRTLEFHQEERNLEGTKEHITEDGSMYVKVVIRFHSKAYNQFTHPASDARAASDFYTWMGSGADLNKLKVGIVVSKEGEGNETIAVLSPEDAEYTNGTVALDQRTKNPFYGSSTGISDGENG